MSKICVLRLVFFGLHFCVPLFGLWSKIRCSFRKKQNLFHFSFFIYLNNFKNKNVIVGNIDYYLACYIFTRYRAHKKNPFIIYTRRVVYIYYLHIIHEEIYMTIIIVNNNE